MKQQDAVLVAHYYTSADLQDLAEETGGCVSDSLEMARFGHAHPAKTLIVAGVKFMGETAKILNPEKRVLMPDLNADCSLDLACPADEFAAFCDAHPDRMSVVYANTSAAVKARADWVVTSGIAVKIVKYLHRQGHKLLWAPDRHLGDYVQRITGADMLLWQGSCVVHEAFKAEALKKLRAEHPARRGAGASRIARSGDRAGRRGGLDHAADRGGAHPAQSRIHRRHRQRHLPQDARRRPRARSCSKRRLRAKAPPASRARTARGWR